MSCKKEKDLGTLFLLIKEGEFTFRFEGDEEMQTAGKNQIVNFPANITFCRCVTKPITLYQIGVIVEDNVYENELMQGILNVPLEYVEKIIESLDMSQSVKNDELFLRYADHIATENYMYEQTKKGKSFRNMDDINFVAKYMQEHLDEKISIEQIAKEVHLSHVGLIWKFKARLAITPMEFLSRLRLTKAKEMLLESDLRINEISYRCGYATPYYFSRRFKETYHLSPADYRKRMLQRQKNGEKET